MNATTPLWAQSLVWALIHFLWQGAALAALLAIALRAQRHSSPAARYATAAIALASMVILVPLTCFQTYAGLREQLHAPAAAGLLSVKAPPLPRTTAIARDPSSSILTPPILSASSGGAAQVPLSAPVMSTGSPDAGRVQNWVADHAIALLGCWLGGVLVLALRLAAGMAQVGRLRRSSWICDGALVEEAYVRLSGLLEITLPVRIAVSPAVDSALTFGWLRPVVLLPLSAVTTLPRAQLEAILAHELAHIKRHDYLANLIQSAVEVMLFYHPAVWWVSGVMRREREHCCDELAAATCWGGGRVLAKALTRLEELRARTAEPALGATGGNLVARVRRLLGKPDPSAPDAIPWLGGAAFAVLAALALFSGQSEATTGMAPLHDLRPWGPAPVSPAGTSLTPAAAPQVVTSATLENFPHHRLSFGPLPDVQPTVETGEVPASGRYAVVAASGVDPTVAERLVDTLTRDGITPSHVRRRPDGMCDVFVGDFATRGETRSLLELLNAAGYRPIGVRPRPIESKRVAVAPLLASAPPDLKTQYSILISSNLDPQQARTLQNAIMNDGFSAVHLLSRPDGRFDVLAGTYDSYTAAERHLGRLRQSSYLPERIVEKPGADLNGIAQVQTRVYNLNPAGRDPKQIREIWSSMLPRLKQQLNPTAPGVWLQRRFWYDPDTLLLTLVDTPDQLERVDSFLQQAWLRRRLGTEDKAGTVTLVRMGLEESLNIGNLGIRLESLAPSEGEPKLEAELLLRLPDKAEVVTLADYISHEIGDYTVTMISARPGPEGPETEMEIWAAK